MNIKSRSEFQWVSGFSLGAMALALVVLLTSQCLAQKKANEKEIEPAPNVLDPDDIAKPNSKVWVLNFRFKEPALRQITVDVPGRGRKVCWYLLYDVVNYTREAHTFIPKFTIVRHDKDKVYKDQILPKVQKAIQELEDPTDYLKIKNSVTISADAIPVSKKDATPKKVIGVAILDDVDADISDFSVFVTGLSTAGQRTTIKFSAERRCN
jgi:hypothetical protein